MNIHESIRYHRRKLELTQAQLAQQVGVTVQAVSKWETGSGMPDTAQLVPLARALRISTDRLLSFEDRTQAFKARWEHALRHSRETSQLQAVCLDILREDPDNTDFLYRAAVNESTMAKETDDTRMRHFHWTMARQYAEHLLRLEPDHECCKEHLVEVLVNLDLRDEAVAQAYRCADASRALLSCLEGDDLRRHRQKRVDRKLRSLLAEIEQLDQPEVCQRLIEAAIPDGNYQHYGFCLFHYSYDRMRSHLKHGDEDSAMEELNKMFKLALAIEERKEQTRFTVPLFDHLEGAQNPPGVPSLMQQFAQEALYSCRSLRHREDFKDLVAAAMSYIPK